MVSSSALQGELLLSPVAELGILGRVSKIRAVTGSAWFGLRFHLGFRFAIFPKFWYKRLPVKIVLHQQNSNPRKENNLENKQKEFISTKGFFN